jgi:hypothetical protein
MFSFPVRNNSLHQGRREWPHFVRVAHEARTSSRRARHRPNGKVPGRHKAKKVLSLRHTWLARFMIV